MTFRSFLSAATVALTVGGLAMLEPATAQDTRVLLDRIERLQRDVDVLQRRVATGAGSGVPTIGSPVPLGATTAEGFVGQAEQRFATIEATNREQTGRIEEIQFKLRQIEGKLDRLIADIDLRFQQLERGGAGPSSQRTEVPAPPPLAGAPGSGTVGANQRLMIVPSGTSAQAIDQQRQQQAAAQPRQPVQLPQGAPEAQYEFAYGLLLQAQRGRADFAPAAEAMQAFVTQNGSHRLAGNAQYWLGETHYVRKDWQGAALAFGEGLKRYPNAEKAPDNLLKLGMSLAQLNRKPDACGALTELDKRYPNAAAPVKQTAQRERQRIGC